MAHLKGDALFPQNPLLFKSKPQLPKEKLIESQRLMCRCGAKVQNGKFRLSWRGMYLPKRLTKRWEFCRAELRRYNADNIRQKTIHDFAHNPAHRFLMNPLRQRIDRHDASEIGRICRQQ